jgi:hypothetical protein
MGTNAVIVNGSIAQESQATCTRVSAPPQIGCTRFGIWLPRFRAICGPTTERSLKIQQYIHLVLVLIAIQPMSHFVVVHRQIAEDFVRLGLQFA